MFRLLLIILFFSFSCIEAASYAQSELAKRIAKGEYIKSKTFYYLTDDNKIYYTTQGYSRVPRAFRNFVYLTNDDAIDGYYKRVNFTYFETNENKAWINTEKKWIYHWGETSKELAVMGAFYNCEFMGLNLNSCKLLYVNEEKISDYDDMYWTRYYLENKDKYKFTVKPSERLIIEKRGNERSPSDDGEEISSGTGFFVNKKGDILTNFHVVENCENNMKARISDDIYSLKLLAKDQNLDLALLQAPLKNDSFITLGSSVPKKLQRVIVAGYPLGKFVSDDLKFNSGVISSLKGPDDNSSLLQVDAAINMGNSGGPIVDEESGHLIAVAVSGLDKSITEGFNFGIKSSSVISFLNSNAIPVPSISRNFLSFQSEDLAGHLEKTTLYIYCSE